MLTRGVSLSLRNCEGGAERGGKSDVASDETPIVTAHHMIQRRMKGLTYEPLEYGMRLPNKTLCGVTRASGTNHQPRRRTRYSV